MPVSFYTFLWPLKFLWKRLQAMLQPGNTIRAIRSLYFMQSLPTLITLPPNSAAWLLRVMHKNTGDWVLEIPGQLLFLVVQRNLLRKVIRTKLKYISLLNAPEFSELSSTLATAVSCSKIEVTYFVEVKPPPLVFAWWEKYPPVKQYRDPDRWRDGGVQTSENNLPLMQRFSIEVHKKQPETQNLAWCASVPCQLLKFKN